MHGQLALLPPVLVLGRRGEAARGGHQAGADLDSSRAGLTILLVDQEIRHALKIADYVYVLELGRNKYEGPVSEFQDLEKAFWVA